MNHLKSCQDFHSSCTVLGLNKLKAVLKYTFKLYSLVHIAPFIAYSKKRNELVKSPMTSLSRILNKIFRSMGFMSTFVMVLRIFTCSLSKLGLKFNFWCLTSCSLFVTMGVLLEDAQRIDDYSIYTLPRVMEGVWEYLKHLGYVNDIKYSMQLIFAVSMGALLVLNKFFSDEIPVTYRNQINFIFGKDEEENEADLNLKKK